MADEIESALMREARISQQGDIREREAFADEKAGLTKRALQLIERNVAAPHEVRIERAGRLAEIDHVEAAHGHIRLVAVLLPEQPSVHFRGGKGVLRSEIAVAREIADDSVGLGQRATVLEVDRRHLPERIELEEFRRAATAALGVHLDPAIGQRKVIADPFRLPAIAGIAVAVDFHGRRLSVEATEQQARATLSIALAGKTDPAGSELVAETSAHRIDAGVDVGGEADVFPLGTREQASNQV